MLVVVKVRKKTTEAGVCRYPAKRQPEGVECGVGQQGAMFERKRVRVLCEWHRLMMREARKGTSVRAVAALVVVRE